MTAAAFRVTSVDIPADCAVARTYQSTDLADAFSVDLPAGTTASLDTLARFIFGRQPAWVDALMKVRDTAVSVFGLKTSAQLKNADGAEHAKRVGIFKIYETTAREIVLGEDDSHLDFRLSLMRSTSTGPNGAHELVLSTVVHCHNRLGRIYIFVIAPFHRAVVCSTLRRAARAGWPRDS